MSKILLKNANPFTLRGNQKKIDILIDEKGMIEKVEETLPTQEGTKVIDLSGMCLTPGWIDLHTHCYWGATNLSVRPDKIGLKQGVTTLVDAGSAGEANFQGFKEFIIKNAKENIYSFLNLGSIGLTACNLVSEIPDYDSYDFERLYNCVQENRDSIVGIKIRASKIIIGKLGLEPVKVSKKLSRLLHIPLMAHIGAVPPLVEDVLKLLTEGDIVTHCCNGKPGGNLYEDPLVVDMMMKKLEDGVLFDIGHGSASFAFNAGKKLFEIGFRPTTISSDLHVHNIDGPVYNLALVMSKMLFLGMSEKEIIKAVTFNPAKAINLDYEQWLCEGKKSNFTAYKIVPKKVHVEDSMKQKVVLEEVFSPQWAILGKHFTKVETKWTS